MAYLNGRCVGFCLEMMLAIFWAGTPDGLNHFTQWKVYYLHVLRRPSERYVRSIYKDHNGYLWVGTRGG